MAHLGHVPGVAADAALAAVGAPHAREAAAVQLVVVVVRRSAEAVPSMDKTIRIGAPLELEPAD